VVQMVLTMTNTTTDQHMLETFRAKRGWLQVRTAKHFGIQYVRYRQIVRGHCGMSLKLAQKLSRRSEGEFSFPQLLLWHQRNKKTAA